MGTTGATIEREGVARTARAYARGALGALLVSMPLLATMEMWWQGFYMPSTKMIVFLVVNFGVLLILEYYSGLRQNSSLREELLDAAAAYGIGLVVATATLILFNELRSGMGANELIGKVLLQSIPLSMGASIAISQLGQDRERQEEHERRSGPLDGLALPLAGAWYFGFNVSPTEEPLMLGLRIDWWHAILLFLAATLVTHAVVYSVDFVGERRIPEGSSWWGTLSSHGVSTAAVAFLTAAFFLWIFGRIGPDTGLAPTLHMIAVLGFVNSFGAAAAKLIL